MQVEGGVDVEARYEEGRVVWMWMEVWRVVWI